MKQGLLTIVKFFGFLLILPLVVAAVLSFQVQLLAIPAHKEQWILWGAVIFVAVFLFLYNFKEVFAFGQNIVAGLLRFFPAAANAGLIIPIYTIIVICGFLILNVTGLHQYEWIILMVLGFTIALHIISSAQQLYEGDTTPIKAQYLFGFGVVLIVNLVVMSLLINFAIKEFSFIDFFHDFSRHAAKYYTTIYNTLFINA